MEDFGLFACFLSERASYQFSCCFCVECCRVININTNYGNDEVLLIFLFFMLQVSDWWEEYIYLRGRGPIMVNSNYFAMVGKCCEHLICHRNTVKSLPVIFFISSVLELQYVVIFFLEYNLKLIS